MKNSKISENYQEFHFHLEIVNWIHPDEYHRHWRWLLCDHQRPLSFESLLRIRLCVFWNDGKMLKNSKISEKTSENSFSFWIEHILMMNVDNEIPVLFLHYEFPAETRLTVYRRLDIRNFVELSMFWSMPNAKMPWECCPWYIEDPDKCIKR